VRIVRLANFVQDHQTPVVWIGVIVIAGGIVIWLYFARPNYDPLGLVVVGWGIIIWLGGRAIRYWLGGR
jgi:hypothetical protein